MLPCFSTNYFYKNNWLIYMNNAEKQKLIKDVVFSARKKPTIVNPDSKFVVVTYWWGRGNANANIARPCMYYYEEFISGLIKLAIDYFMNIHTRAFQSKVKLPSDLQTELNMYSYHLLKTAKFNKFIESQAKGFLHGLYIDLDLINNKDPKRYENAKNGISMMKEDGTCPPDFNLLDINATENECLTNVKVILTDIASVIYASKPISEGIFDIFQLKRGVSNMKQLVFPKNKTKSADYMTVIDMVKDPVIESARRRTITMDAIKALLKQKGHVALPIINLTFENSNIYDVLNALLRFRVAMPFEQMIDRWEKSCKYAKCNYLAVEYDYFSRTKQYQLAINAKPLFIKKALHLCRGRSVVYIDGDMSIQKYPHIFDIDNIDFMSRGWNIDPRASYNLGTSISFNPYKFETSGGIMYFSNTPEAVTLMNLWIVECAKPENSGKADDRILSMIFNMKKFMLNMNIIQLPVEYLWLTLDYNDRMLEYIYDWDKDEMNSTIFIDHPECLTSEETAEGAGASSDRTPKLHRFLDAEDDNFNISEEFYEAFAFKNKQMANQFRDYFHYLDNATYLNDGNPQLVENGFVNLDHPEENLRPLYITPFDQKFGPKRNAIVKKNNHIMNSEIDANFWKSTLGTKIISNKIDKQTVVLPEHLVPGGEDNSGHVSEYLFPIIMALMNMGLNVIYLPTSCRDNCYFRLLYNRSAHIDLVFFPVIGKMNHILAPVIDINQPISFSTHPESLLYTALSMFENLEDLSQTFQEGAYQIISRIRISYVFKSAGKPDSAKYISNYQNPLHVESLSEPSSPLSDGDLKPAAGSPAKNIAKDVSNYIAGQNQMYKSKLKKPSKKYTKKHPRKNKNKRTRIHSKH